MNKFINKIHLGNCVDIMQKLPENSISGCVTDPPYNYEFFGHKWDNQEIERRKENAKNNNSTLIKYIPYGSGLAGGVRNERWYGKNRENILDYQRWCEEWGKELYRVLKPGAYAFIFNSSRTIAHVQIAMENMGFYTRDIFVWIRNSGIPKGLNFSSQLQKKGVEDYKKWKNWHSATRTNWEAILVVQKPLINNYLETFNQYKVGLLKTKNDIDESFLSNIFEDYKRDKKDEFNKHITVKPLSLIEKLIEISIPPFEDNIVIDPFMGSGTTALAAKKLNINFIGCEISNEYLEISEQRLKSLSIN